MSDPQAASVVAAFEAWWKARKGNMDRPFFKDKPAAYQVWEAAHQAGRVAGLEETIKLWKDPWKLDAWSFIQQLCDRAAQGAG
mgnify:CR=1 FL=1